MLLNELRGRYLDEREETNVKPADKSFDEMMNSDEYGYIEKLHKRQLSPRFVLRQDELRQKGLAGCSARVLAHVL